MVTELPYLWNGIQLEYRFPISIAGPAMAILRAVDQLIRTLPLESPKILVCNMFGIPVVRQLARIPWCRVDYMKLGAFDSFVYTVCEDLDHHSELFRNYDVIIMDREHVPISLLLLAARYNCLLVVSELLYWVRESSKWMHHGSAPYGDRYPITPTHVSITKLGSRIYTWDNDRTPGQVLRSYGADTPKLFYQ